AARLLPSASDVLVGLRPEDLEIADTRDDAILAGVAEVVEELGTRAYAYVRTTGVEVVQLGERPVELTGTVVVELDIVHTVAPGDRIRLRLARDHLHLFDPSTEQTLLARPNAPAGLETEPESLSTR